MTLDPNIKILVVKDDAPLRALIQSYLNAMGFTNVIQKEEGQAGLNYLSEEKVGFIISDWRMPVLDGLEFFKILTRKNEWKNIPFLMITSNREDIKEVVQAGVENYLTIPFKQESFRRKVEAMLKIASNR